MATKNVGMAFSREFVGGNPLGHIGVKNPVYNRFLELCAARGWNTYVLTRKTYKGGGIFEGSWKYSGGRFKVVREPVKIDLVYDRCAGVKFPPEGDRSLVWVNELDFKILAWDKWAAYKVIGQYMPGTFLVENENRIPQVLSKIESDWVVLKPYNGLKGAGIFIGPKERAMSFKFGERYKRYIAQEFIDTSHGIPGVTGGMHDLRVVIVNGKVVWCHVRVPPKGSYKANAATGGELREVSLSLIPENVMKIVGKIAKRFYEEYGNPVYSLDFGMGKNGAAKIFEINDQMGFPRWEMKERDNFLNSLVDNFADKLV